MFSHVRLFGTPWTAARQTSLSIINSWSLLKLMSIELVMPSNHLILCRPLLILSSIFPSVRSFPMSQFFAWVGQNIGASASVWMRIDSMNECSRLLSFSIDWFHLLAVQVQGTLKSLIQHHSSKSSIVWHSAFFMVQLSHPCMTPGKTIALTRQTFVGKVTSLLFNVLSRLVIAFSPRCKRLLISWLQAPSAVILEPRNIVHHCFHCFSTYLPSNDGTGCHDFHFLNVEFLARFHSPLSLSSRSSLVLLCFLP